MRLNFPGVWDVPFIVNVRFSTMAASAPPWKVTTRCCELFTAAVTATIFVLCTLPVIPNTNAAITAARITVMATIRITPMTGIPHLHSL